MSIIFKMYKILSLRSHDLYKIKPTTKSVIAILNTEYLIQSWHKFHITLFLHVIHSFSNRVGHIIHADV